MSTASQKLPESFASNQNNPVLSTVGLAVSAPDSMLLFSEYHLKEIVPVTELGFANPCNVIAGCKQVSMVSLPAKTVGWFRSAFMKMVSNRVHPLFFSVI
jgi:hypothetical protein